MREIEIIGKLRNKKALRVVAAGMLVLTAVGISAPDTSAMQAAAAPSAPSAPSAPRDAVQYVTMNGIRVLKVNLQHPEIQVVALQANDSGGAETVQSMAARHGAIAAINGDYFSYFDQVATTWPEGMFYMNGRDLTRCRPGFDCAQYRSSIAFSSSDRPNIERNRGGRDLYNVVAGGPQFTYGGTYRWDFQVQGGCPGSGQVVINGDVFGCSAASWGSANTISAVGYSDDGNTLYLAASEGNKTMQEMHDVLWQQGSRNNLRLDSGGSRTLYYNGNGGQWTLGGGRAVANAIAIIPATSPPPPPPPPAGSTHVEYFPNRDLRDRCYDGYESGPYVNKHWGGGSPAGGCPSDNFSARFTSNPSFQGGDYRFHCQHDDGCRIYIDGQLRLDAWWSSSFEGHDWGGYLSPGNHEIRIELFEGGGDAELEAWWQGPGYLPRDEGCNTANQWCFEGYGNRDLRGTSWLRRGEGTAPALDYRWGSGGFGYGMSSDNFSARYSRTLDLTCGRYRFDVAADDGVRLWTNNNLILDRWQDQHTSYSSDVDLPGGPVPLRVEYYENGGEALLQVNWTLLSACPATATPTFSVTATSTPTVTPTATPTNTASSTPSDTATVTNTATNTVTNTVTNTATRTDTATNTATETMTPTSTASSTQVPSSTATSTSSASPSSTPTTTSIPTASSTATTSTQTQTSSATRTEVPASTQTSTISTAVASPTYTRLAESSATATRSVTGTATQATHQTATNTIPATSTIANTVTNTVTATVTATPIACRVEFADVPADSSFYPFVRCLACRDILSGYACGGVGEECNSSNDSYFRPGNQITRGQIAKVVSSAAGFSEDPGEQVFADVEKDSPFFPWVNRLANRGYMSGYSCNSVPAEPCGSGNRSYFRPNANATRGQLSKIVSNAASFNDAHSEQSFRDVPVDSPFYIWIQRLASRGFIGGYPCGTTAEEACGNGNQAYFRPNANVTRGQAAKIVANTFYANCPTPANR